MSKKTLAVLSLAIAVVFLLSSTACVSKKRLERVEQENAQQMAQANARIDELTKKNETLDKGLTDTQSALAGAQSENKQLASNAASLKDQLAALEGQKTELDKALAAGKETEASYQKKVRSLNGAIGNLRTKVAEMETLIAAKEADIAALQQTEASLKAAAEEQSNKLAALTADKNSLTAELDKTVASKKSTTLILGILLGLAIILALVGFLRGRKTAA
jgi:chromosome segregation ATPase